MVVNRGFLSKAETAALRPCHPTPGCLTRKKPEFKDTRTPEFTATLFTQAEREKQPKRHPQQKGKGETNGSQGQWSLYYSARNENLINATGRKPG